MTRTSPDIAPGLVERLERSKAAATELTRATSLMRDAALQEIQKTLESHVDDIVAANGQDLSGA